MKTAYSYLLIALFSIGNLFVCVAQPSQSDELPVFDLSKNYGVEKIKLQDLADIEYVPLETSDDILLSGDAFLSAVSDKYILMHEPRKGDVFLFDRHTGKLVSHFNHRGGSGQEYAWIKNGVLLDEDAGEIYVCAQYIQVYSLTGEYKRTLKISGFKTDLKIINFDANSLLIYEDVIVDPYVKAKTKDKPYYFVSKKDGSTISTLNICLPKRYSKTIIQTKGNMYRPFKFHYAENYFYGKDILIMDISSDTLYLLSQSKNLKPILARTPSVHASDPRTIWMPNLMTDDYLLFGKFTLDFTTTGGKIPTYMYTFKTGEAKEVSIIDTEYDSRGRGGWTPVGTAIEKNCAAGLIEASDMIEAKNKGRLLGNGNEVAKNLTEDDNQVVRILKFK